MAASHGFEHLPLVLRKQGDARFPSSPFPPNDEVQANRQNRATHSHRLSQNATQVQNSWTSRQKRRAEEGLPEIDGLPLLLRIDPLFDVDELRSAFDFESISEEEDGFVIVASGDPALSTLRSRLNDFISEVRGSANVARLLDLRQDPSQEERLRRILSERLFAEWHTMEADAIYICDFSIACAGTWEIKAKPKRNPRWSDAVWAKRELEWSTARNQAYIYWDELKEQRLEIVDEIIGFYGGEILDNVDGAPVDAPTLPDSFTLRIKMAAKGLKDLVLNFPYVFEVTEPDDIQLPQDDAREYKLLQANLDLQAPDPDAPAVCIVDSGIQEEHVLLAAAIEKAASYCFLNNVSTTDVADYVAPSGHGTRVAGAVIHGESVPDSGTIQSPFWIQNARILDAQNCLPTEMFPPSVLREVVTHYRKSGTRIFNHSVNSESPSRTVHMSAWAAEIDRLCYDDDLLVIQSAGNLRQSRPSPNPGVSELHFGVRAYPDYLSERCCRIANPAQSLQAISVGSVGYGEFAAQDHRSFARNPGAPSAFTRCGPGIWGSIKPEVVEYGGDYLTAANSVVTPTLGAPCYPELVRSTLHGRPAVDRDGVGTSFAAPKVSRIAARLQATLPDESCLLYRALIIQSARWPEWGERLDSTSQVNLLHRIGYGIPDTERASANTDHRVTLISQGESSICAKECHVYQIPIPSELRRPGYDYDIRVEVTLSYVAQPRRTRRTHRGYLATWVDWMSNRLGESLDTFVGRALKDQEEQEKEGSSSGWTLDNNAVWGQLKGVRRNVGTVQKDWTTLRSHQLPEDLCIAVRGHKGWSNDPEAAARYALVVSFESLGQKIAVYEPIRTAVLELQQELSVDSGIIELEVDGE
jgi:hypothetical protein